ncbi:PLxRFG domain-containing protein [Comamonas testosteroni]|uniref:PLxRFG domain-containing protein n=1 Tax=Comamonas testosteroni TaxID=285 RepID=UPI00265EB309|nr:PLxRFG domain-containing protein [Comamonas testosteroni]WKL18674.1 PLxRFG domain-containing protein [Comamonas testosteroni]
MVTGGKAGKALENEGGSFGLRFKQAREVANDLHSDATKLRQQQFQQADGVVEKAKVAVQNPSLVVGAVAESLPSMLAGGGVGRGLMAATRLGQMGAKGAAIAGAAGEGVVGAGSAAEQIRQETADGELTAKQAALAAGTGLATGALGFAGNKVANRLGIGDADMMLAQGTKGMAKDAAERATAAAVNPLAQPAQKSILRQMGEGAITEGVLEELPQSVSEQILQNEALGKSWSEGLDDAIVMGILSGGAMGAGAAGYRGFKDKQIDDAAANAKKVAANVPGAAPGQDSAAGGLPPAQWTTSAGAAARAEPGTAPASPANAPNLDYETLPGAAPEAVGKEIPFEREFDTGGLSLQSTQPAAVAPVLDHDALRDKAGVMMPPQLDSGRIEVATGLQPLSNEQPPRQWDTGNLSLVGEAQPQAPLSQRMGLDPKAGALSKAAAMAVDSGASPVVQPQMAPVQQQATPQVPAGVDPETGEVSLQAQMDELKSRIAFMQQQGAAQGWDGNRAAQRNALQTQLTRLELQAAGGQGRGASTAGAPAPVQLTGINQILAKQIPDMNEQELQQAIAHYGPTHKRTKKLEKALQALAQKPLTAIESGANANVSEADQAQQGSAQPSQAGAAQAGQDADQGVGNGTTPTANPGAQEQGASLAKAQAQVSEAAGAAQAAVGKAAQIAREGNAEREAQRQRQRQLDASERWTRMTTAERQAVAATAPGLTVIARKNVHTRAWPDLGEKIREKLLDSLVAPLVESTSKAPAAIENAAKPAPNAVSGDALPKPAAQPVGDEKPFTAETGTLGIPRADMPQVPTANHGGLVKHLKAQGISHETTTVDAAQLKPTQAEYSPSKVEAAKTATGDRAVIVSSDGHIIDGHHQAVAAAEEGKHVKAIVLDAPVEKALAAVKASPSANIEAAPERYKYPAIGNTKPAQYELQKAAVDYLNGDVGKSELVTKAAQALRDGVTLGQVHALYMRTSDFTTGDGYAAVRASSPEMAKALDIVQDGKVSKWAAVKQIAALGLNGSQLKAVTQDGSVFGKDFSDADLEVMQAKVAPAAPVAAPKSVPERMKEAKAAKEAASAAAPDPATQAASVQEQPDSGDFPMSEAVQSYSGISHSGRSRADGDKQAFDKYMESARAAAEKLATTDAQRDALAAATDSLRADYLKQYRSLMNVRAGAYSGFVAGRGNLNSKQANSRNSALDKAMERFDSWAGDNADRVSKAVLAARTPEQVKADKDKVAADIKEKADKKAANLKAQLLKFLRFKSGEEMPYGKNAIITRVSYDRDGYPSSLTFKMADGSALTNDKVELVPTLKGKDETLEQAKTRIRALVDELRAENPELVKGIGAMRAAASAKAEKPAVKEDSSPAPASFLDRHNTIDDGINSGQLALDDYKSAFAELESNPDAVHAELQKLTKDQLLRAGGPAFAYRMGSEKKDAIVLAAYQKMLDTYALGRSYGPSFQILSAANIAKNKADKAQALRELVGNTTAEDLAARAAEIKALRDEFKAKRAAEADALANPKTLQDYRGFMSHWVDQGDTSEAAYLRLTPEQRQQFDALEAEQTKDQREAEKRRARVTVQSAGNTTAGEIIATKHTKHGHDLFVVQLAERVERDAYDTLNSSAKRLGGSYSSYRGNGAVPGFQFRTREAAEAFQKLVAGDTAQAQDLANQRRDAFEDDKSQSAAERLRTMAEALDERATESLGVDRKANTARRARFAASAEAAARMQQALAGTMRNIAQAIDEGRAKFLDGVRQRVQVEYLMAQLRTAKSNQLQAKYPNYGERMNRVGEPIDGETVDFAQFPRFEMYRSDLASLARQLQEIEGGKKMGAALGRLADDVTDAYTNWAKENLLRVSHFGNKAAGGFAEFTNKETAERAIKRSGLVGKAIVLQVKRGQNRVVLSPGEAMQQGLWQGDGDKRIRLGMGFVEDLVKLGKRKGSKALSLPWQLESAYENRQRLQRMGIQSPAEFRSALRELASLQQEMGSPDRIKEMERAMVGRANDGLDFFPTSPAVVQSMLDAAEIAEGMAVLEPSAGMGHIADAIVAESGAWPDVVELSPSRRELLEAKGFHLAEANDFLQMEPRNFFTFGDTFRAPDGVEGTMRGVGSMGSQRVRLEDGDGNRLGLYNRDELTGIAQNGSWSGYDRIIMNPPFSDGRDIQHVMHAYSLLRPGGRIVAIMGEGAFFQSNKRAEGFREWLDERGATNEKLPDGSFMDPSLPVNTGVAARMVVVDKPAGDMVTDDTGAPSFRRQESEQLAGAAFDVASFLQGMGEGLPANLSAAAAPAVNVRPSYSPAARAEAVRAVKGTADAIRQAWANGPEVIVAFDMQDPVVPESARRADLKQRSGGARGAPEGFYYQGKVYLMASKLKTPNDAARVLFHEALGHHGLRGLFGKDLGLILNQVATMRKADVDAKIAEYGLRRVNRLDRRTAAEEVLAEMAQNTPQIGFVRRAVAAIRTWLRTHVPRFKSLALTDDELIRNFILPARVWVERGAGVNTSQDIAFSRTSATSMPDAVIGSTLGSASSHPDYAAAKGGDIEAAVRLAQHLVTPELVAKVKAAIGDSKPRVVPVAAVEASGRNKIPVAAAEVLAARLGLSTDDMIVQANRAHRTGMDGLDRIFAPVDFSGAVQAVPYLLVDDTLTQGGTFAALASHIREGGGTVAGVIALTGKQYSAKIQPSAESLASLRQKHGDLENEFRAATGYGFDALTESEARYLARYEPAERLRDRITAEGNASRAGEDPGNSGPDGVNDDPVFSRSRFADLKDSALDQLTKTFTHEGKVSLWDKSVGTMRHLAERAPSFKPVYESAQQNIDDVSMLANDAADMAPRILPRVESLGDLKKKPVSAADNKAVARPLFEGTLIWARDENGKPTLVDDLQKRYANLSAHNKAAMLLKHGKIDAGVLAMWQGLPVAQFEKLINSRFENKMLKPGIVWTDAELQAQFGTDANQISLYREARAAIDRSIDMTARTDMLRVVGEKYEPMRDAVLAQPSVEAAAQLLLDTLEQDAKADPDSADRLGRYMQQIKSRMETAVDLQQGGYAPLSRFGRYTVDVVDANGERLYFGMYETARDSNRAKMQLEHEFKGATITTGTMSAEAYKLFAGVTPETLEQFGEMLGLKAEGNEAQDKAFQEFLKLTKNNHSAMKRLIHRKGIAGFSEDVGRVVANFVYSNARAGAMGLNAGKMETAIGKIPKEQGELKDLAMGLRDYIRDPQEEGQAVRGMLFAQYLGGSIASAFVNTTQPFAVTLPWLSQYGGMKKAGAQLARALKDMGRSVADEGFEYEADLAKALQAAEDDGVVSPQEIHQLMAQARGAGMLRSGDGTKAGDLRAKAGNLWEQGKVLWGQPFALAEQFNRRSTFIAAYRTAQDQGMADPAAFARKAVLETQFVYSKATKPKWARGAVGGTIFTFKTYSVSYLELMHRMWNQGGPEGKRAVGWALAMLLLMSGAGGVPFMEDAEDLIDGAGQMMGYNISAKQWRKELLANVVGKELGEFMEQGLSGLPGAPIDVSGRLGMGNLLPGTGLFLNKPNRERDLMEIVGPAGDLVARGFTGARKLLGGDVAGAALEISPTAVRNLAKGADMAATGMYRDTKGYKVIDTTLAEAAAKAIGFQPKSVAEVQEANSFMQRSKSFYTQTSSDIKAQWADALFRKDEAAVQRVRERLAAWNRDNPEQPIVVKMPDVWKRVREMGKDRSDRIADTAPKALRMQMREQVRSLG